MIIDNACPGCGFERGEGHGFMCELSREQQKEFDLKEWVLVKRLPKPEVK
jgi:hypothetical protein